MSPPLQPSLDLLLQRALLVAKIGVVPGGLFEEGSPAALRLVDFLELSKKEPSKGSCVGLIILASRSADQVVLSGIAHDNSVDDLLQDTSRPESQRAFLQRQRFAVRDNAVDLLPKVLAAGLEGRSASVGPFLVHPGHRAGARVNIQADVSC